MADLLSDYEVRKALYESERTTVYRARDRDSGDPVILKLLSTRRPSPRDVLAFQREVEIADGLEGDHFVDVLAFERTADGLMIVQEDFGGESLDKILNTHRFDLETFLEIALGITEALTDLHRQQIIHKDVNPSNILWNPDTGELKIMDFGLSTRRQREYPEWGPPTETEGTLPYISPEQTGRTDRVIDYRTDFYSLGVTLFELWTGQLPFEDGDAAGLIHKHLAQSPPSMESRRLDTPAQLSKIVAKLLSKTAERRYRHAVGIYADLETCLNQWRRDGEIGDFELGRKDISDRLILPQELFGRDDELAVLTNDVRKSERGARRLRLVCGSSGTGKSALLTRFRTLIPSKAARFAIGRFDSRRSSPYTVVGGMLDELTIDLLGRGGVELSRQRHRLEKALGDDLSLLVHLVPAIRRLVDRDIEALDVDIREARHRFQQAVRNFVALLTRHSRPLVLMFDDLQWADSATLELIQWLLCDDSIGHLLVIATYRTGAADARHSVDALLQPLREREQNVEITNLGPLNHFAVLDYVAASLHLPPSDVASLAEVVSQKTGGVPYFMGQFLLDLHRRSLLWFDDHEHRWSWNLDEIEAAPVTENVVQLLTRHIDEVADDTAELLQFAALLGQRFSLRDLASLFRLSVTEVLERLEPVIDRDLLLPLSRSTLTDSDDATAIVSDLIFPHDRVRELFSQRFDDDERRRAHLRIARRLHSRLDEDGTDALFELVEHYERASPCIDDPGERVDVAALQLEAGRRAIDAQAPRDAARYLASADDLLGHRVWDEHPELARVLYIHRARIESLLGRYDTAEHLARIGLEHTGDPVERVPFFITLIRQLVRRTEFDAAVEHARQALRPFELSIPQEEDLDQALMTEMSRVEQRLAGRDIEAIADLRVVEDERADAALQLLSTIQPLAGMLDRRLLLLVGLQATSITLHVGIRPQSVAALAMYGAALCSIGGYERGYRAGTLAVEKARTFGNQSNLAHAAFTFGALILPWCRHLSRSFSVLEEGLRAARRSENILFIGYNAIFHAFHNFFAGRRLVDVHDEMSQCVALGRKLGHSAVEDAGHAYTLIARNLLGETESAQDFSSEDFPGADALIEHSEARGNDATSAIFRIARAQVLYLYGDSDKALEELRSVEENIDVLLGSYDAARHPFLHSLALIDVALQTDDEEKRRQLLEPLASMRDRLARLADKCPENFLHKSLLVAAEKARLDGDVKAAMNLYDRSIAEARRADFFHLEALANERAGLFWEAHDKREFSVFYLSNARVGYGLWGAKRKVALLDEHHDLRGLRADAQTTSGDTTGGDSIDVISVFKSSELIASRLELDELLPTLLQVTLENAGAQRGAFVVAENDELFVSVEGEIDEDPVLHEEGSVPLSDWRGGAESIVRYVHRTAEPVVLGKAVREPRFRGDPYIERRRPGSILCVPVAEHNRARGVLYVENNLVDNAFTDERARVLEVLAGHIAVALGKAQLYAELDEERERFRQLAENIQEVFWLMDAPSKTIIYVSPAYETVWGRPVPDGPLSIDEWIEAVVAEDRHRIGKALADETVSGDYDATYRIEQPHGRIRWIRDRGFPIRNRDGEVFRVAGVAMDITREREVANMKDEILSVVSHELRTPLTPIIGVFSMLDDRLSDELPADTADMVRLGLRNSRRLLRLVDDLLDVQRLSHGQITFDVEVFDVRELVDEAVKFQEPIAGSRDVELQSRGWPRPLCVEADRDRLLQVVRNLLANAVKFSDSGDSVEVELRRRGDDVQLAITDHGPGIPSELRDQIFDKFTQADSSLTRRHGGTGLGLAIAHSIIEKLGGQIYFETELGEGTTFYVELGVVSD